MLYYQFKDYEGFKELFGLRECGNGVKTRRNKILLAYLKQHSLLKGAIAGDAYALERLRIDDMSTLLQYLKRDINYVAREQLNWMSRRVIDLGDWRMYSEKYRLDGQNGICEDKDYRSVRYINLENDRVFKMKAGKFLKSVLMETEFGRSIPEPVLLWLCEEFTQAWETYTRGVIPEYELHIDDEFGKIYDGDWLEGDFHSCMVDEGNESFYEDYCNCKAAYLTNNDDMVIARCIIFNEVHVMNGDLKGKVLRLAERQYSSDGEEVLKRCLVDALINAGAIDGYKRVGADCHSGHAFVLNDGTSLSADMWIRCDADDGDTCSYMDSFKYLDTDSGRAYNDGCYDHNAELDTTDGHVTVEDKNYDDWHDCYTRNELQRVFYGGREYYCDEERLDDFVWVEQEQEYHHTDDVCTCPECGEYFLCDNGVYSELTEGDYCDDGCREAAEDRWKRNHGWAWSEYEGEWFENEEDVTTFVNMFGREETISVAKLDELIDDEKVQLNEESGIYEYV